MARKSSKPKEADPQEVKAASSQDEANAVIAENQTPHTMEEIGSNIDATYPEKAPEVNPMANPSGQVADSLGAGDRDYDAKQRAVAAMRAVADTIESEPAPQRQAEGDAPAPSSREIRHLDGVVVVLEVPGTNGEPAALRTFPATAGDAPLTFIESGVQKGGVDVRGGSLRVGLSEAKGEMLAAVHILTWGPTQPIEYLAGVPYDPTGKQHRSFHIPGQV